MGDKRDRLTPASNGAAYPARRAVLAGLGAAAFAAGLGACVTQGEPAMIDAGPDAGSDASVWVSDGAAPHDAGPPDALPDTGLAGVPLPDDADPDAE